MLLGLGLGALAYKAFRKQVRVYAVEKDNFADGNNWTPKRKVLDGYTSGVSFDVREVPKERFTTMTDELVLPRSFGDAASVRQLWQGGAYASGLINDNRTPIEIGSSSMPRL